MLELAKNGQSKDHTGRIVLGAPRDGDEVGHLVRQLLEVLRDRSGHRPPSEDDTPIVTGQEGIPLVEIVQALARTQHGSIAPPAAPRKAGQWAGGLGALGTLVIAGATWLHGQAMATIEQEVAPVHARLEAVETKVGVLEQQVTKVQTGVTTLVDRSTRDDTLATAKARVEKYRVEYTEALAEWATHRHGPRPQKSDAYVEAELELEGLEKHD